MESIVGHEKNKKYFQNVIRNESLGHAYLLSGPEMIGKKLFALGLYERLNGHIIDNEPDFKFIFPKIEDGETKLYIEDIRELKKFLSFRPYQRPYKVVVIDDAHRLTTEASNALLKALEEPSAFSVLFLVTHLPKSLPQTILSRCEEVTFLPAYPTEVAEFLKDKKISKFDKEFLTKISFGRLGFIKRLLEENKLNYAKKSVDDLRKLLGKGIFEKIDYAKKIHEDQDYIQLVNYWLNWLYASLDNSPKNIRIVKNLSELNNIISQPQFNHRLALENFLLNL